METNILYMTGATPEGEPLLGGVWRIAHQEGFPLELSHMLAREKGCLIDWLEAMADASADDNLPALMRQLESFMDAATLLRLRLSFQHVVCRRGKTYGQIIAEKRANGSAFANAPAAFFGAAAERERCLTP